MPSKKKYPVIRPSNLDEVEPVVYDTIAKRPGARVESEVGPAPQLLVPDQPALIPDAKANEQSDNGRVNSELMRRAQSLLAELTNRTTEALGIYRPLEAVDQFHASRAQIRLLRGSNRSGKTLGAAVEIARAVTGQDPYGKWPTKDGRLFCIGKDGKHLGDVMYRKLFKPRAFLIIRDNETKQWRAWRPYDPADLARASETRPAPPLIPKRFVKEISWENKKSGIPSIVRLHNGWELNFFSSLAKPPQGSDIDLCLAGWARVYDPVAGTMRRIDEIDGPWHVESYNEASGKLEVMPAKRPFIKGWGELCKVTLSNGMVMHTTRRHRVLAADGRWMSVQQAHEVEAPLMASRHAGQPQDHGREVRAELSLERRQELLPSGPCSWPSGATQAPGLKRRQDYGVRSPLSREASCDLTLKEEAQGSQSNCLTDCDLCGEQSRRQQEVSRCGVTSPIDVHECIHLSRNSGDLDSKRECSRHQSLASSLLADAAQVCVFSYQTQPAHRELSAFRSQEPSQSPGYSSRFPNTTSRPPLDSHASVGAVRACESELQLQAASGEHSGCACENGSSASQLHAARPHTVGEFLRCQETVETGCDAGGETSRSFEKASSCFVYIVGIEELGFGCIWDFGVEKNHNYVYAGAISHNCWFDEEIVDPEWVPEMQARILDRRGKIIWSATPQAGTQHLFDLHQRAVDEKDDPNKQVDEFVALLADNRFMSEEAKADFIRNIANEDERLVRIGGEFAISGFKVYPEWGDRHLVKSFDIPHTWTSYAYVDPGRQRCAVTFFAVPPPEANDPHVYCYDEAYIKDCDARKFASTFADKARQRQFQCFYIDYKEASKHETGSGLTIIEQYAAEMKRQGIKSVESGHSFLPGVSDLKAGIEAVRGWLMEDQDGVVKLRVFKEKCPNLDHEMRRYHYKRVGGITTDDPVKRNDHLVDTLRYAAASMPKYKKPVKKSKSVSAIMQYLAWKAKRKNKGKSKSINLGPGKRNG